MNVAHTATDTRSAPQKRRHNKIQPNAKVVYELPPKIHAHVLFNPGIFGTPASRYWWTTWEAAYKKSPLMLTKKKNSSSSLLHWIKCLSK